MKKILILLALITQGLFTINAQPIITVLSPTQGDSLTLGLTRAINVIIESNVQTNVWIWINGLGNGYSLSSGWLAMSQNIPAGKSTNTYTVPMGIIGGDGFSITVAIEDNNPYPGTINPYAESSEFAITDLPTITITPLIQKRNQVLNLYAQYLYYLELELSYLYFYLNKQPNHDNQISIPDPLPQSEDFHYS